MAKAAWCWWRTAKTPTAVLVGNRADGASLPPRNNRENRGKGVRDQAVPTIFKPVRRVVEAEWLIVTVEVPVLRDGNVCSTTSPSSPPIELFQAMIVQLAPEPQDWTISIFDREGTNLAREPNYRRRPSACAPRHSL